MNPRLATLRASLEGAGLEASTVRSAPGEGAAPEEFRLLVHARERPVLDRIAHAGGFVAVPGGNAANELRYLAWDPDDGRFLSVTADVIHAGRSRPHPVARLRAIASRLATLRRRRGLSVALLGPDGSGKSTLAAGIADAFPLPVVQVYMGLWKSGPDQGGLQLREAAVRPFRALRRSADALGHQARGRLVVFDRFVYDARLPPSPPAVVAKRIYFWLLSRVCPAPDLVLLLDVPGAVSYARKGENGAAANEVVRRQYLALAQELHLHVLDAARPAAAVRADALRVIWEAYRQRWSGDGTVPLAQAPVAGTVVA